MVFGKEYIMRCSSAEWIECLEMVVWAGKLRKLWDSLRKLRSSLCVKDEWKGQF